MQTGTVQKVWSVSGKGERQSEFLVKEVIIITVKEYLMLVSKKDAELDNLQNDKESLEAMLYSFGGRTDGDRVQSSRENDKFGSLFSRIDEKEQKIISAIEELINFKLRVSGQINALKDKRHVKLLYMRYIQYQSFETISVEMGYTYQYLIELHGQALKEFSKTYKTLLKTYEAA